MWYDICVRAEADELFCARIYHTYKKGREKMKMKKILAALTAAALSMGALGVTAFAEDNVIDVTAENAQDVLDGKEGSIDGKTINFTESINEVLELARPTKYPGSGTTYYVRNSGEQIADVSELKDNVGYKYERTVSNVTFTADKDVKLAGFRYKSSHMYGTSTAAVHDYVRDIDITSTNNSYNQHSNLKNVKFQGLTITDKIDFASSVTTVVSDITIDGCEFTGDEAKMGTNGFSAIVMKPEAPYYYTNLTVSNCKITNYFQGIYGYGFDGVNIINNTITNTKHNAIALQHNIHTDVGAINPVKGAISVKENYIYGAQDRAIRFGNIDASADIKINNNIMVNSGDKDGQLIKPGTIADGAVIDLENNYWDGREVNKAVANLPQPVMTGVAGGTFKVDITNYVASNCEQVDNGDGTYGVKVKPADITTENVGAKTGKDETVATGFLTKISNAGVIKSIRWTVTSGDTLKNSEKYNLDISLGGDALLGLVVNGLSDGNATATAVINE